MPECIALNVDCIEYMKLLPDNAFDLAVVDPPYGDGLAERERESWSRFGERFDRYRKPKEIQPIRGGIRQVQINRGADEICQADRLDTHTHYCCNCGADMREVEHD